MSFKNVALYGWNAGALGLFCFGRFIVLCVLTPWSVACPSLLLVDSGNYLHRRPTDYRFSEILLSVPGWRECYGQDCISGPIIVLIPSLLERIFIPWSFRSSLRLPS